MNDKVSIIVPCYNAEPYIESCLNSVLQQTYPHWECWVINDGSPDTDALQKTLEPYLENPKIHLVTQQNRGLPGARNTGIQHATGKYILPLDADDMLEPMALEKMVDTFKKNPDALVVYCDAQLFGGKDEEALVLRNFSIKELLIMNRPFCASMYKKEDLNNQLLYDEYLKIGLEDWDFWLSLWTVHRNKKFVYAGGKYLKKRETSDSMLKEIKKDEDRIEKVNHYIYNKHQDLYHEFFPSYLQLLHRKTFYEEKLESIYNSSFYKTYNRIMKFLK